jgi:hypothetical protein
MIFTYLLGLFLRLSYIGVISTIILGYTIPIARTSSSRSTTGTLDNYRVAPSYSRGALGLGARRLSLSISRPRLNILIFFILIIILIVLLSSLLLSLSTHLRG